jgi:hypothetical protein
MSEQPKPPWAALIILLVVSAIGWVTVLSGALEATSAPQNLILVLSKVGTAAGVLGLLLLVALRLRTPKA